ncbi:MAG: hypothetical protein ACRCSO_04125 [Sphingomonas sp.]
MIAVVAGALILMLWLRPDWVASRQLHRLTVLPLARIANGITRQHLLFALLMVAVLLLAGEVIAALGPLDMSLVLLWDVAGLADALITAVSVAVVARSAARFWRLVPMARRRSPAPRPPRQRRARLTLNRADNDDDRPAVLRAA